MKKHRLFSLFCFSLIYGYARLLSHPKTTEPSKAKQETSTKEDQVLKRGQWEMISHIRNCNVIKAMVNLALNMMNQQTICCI